MLTIRSTAQMVEALASPLDDELKRLLTQHRDNLAEYEGYDLGELAFFVVAEIGDTAASVMDALGFEHTGEPGNPDPRGPRLLQAPELLVHHEKWTELVFILSDDGFGAVVLLPADDKFDRWVTANADPYSIRRRASACPDRSQIEGTPT